MLLKSAICYAAVLVCNLSRSLADSNFEWRRCKGSESETLYKKGTSQSRQFLNTAKWKPIETCKRTLRQLNISKNHNILVIGESNFSFSKILAEGLQTVHIETHDSIQPVEDWYKINGVRRQRMKHVSSTQYVCKYERKLNKRLVCTSLDAVKKQHEEFKDRNVKFLETHDLCEVLSEVDATKLDATAELNGKKFDRIIWTFPYNPKYDRAHDTTENKNDDETFNPLRSGEADSPVRSEEVDRRQRNERNKRYKRQRYLIMEFVKSAENYLSPNGEIHILLNGKGYGQYTYWCLRGLETNDYLPIKFRRVKDPIPIRFHEDGRCRDFPGYNATKTSGQKWHKGMNMENPQMHIFKRVEDC